MRPLGKYRDSERLYAEARSVMAGGVSSNFRLGESPVPLFFDRANGAYLFDVDGNRYIDYAMGMGPAILGHAPRAVVRAVAASLTSGQLYAGQHRAEVGLAQRLIRLVPCAERVRFGLSGTEMVQVALRVARAATGRTLIVKFEGHYHGWMDSIYVNVAPAATGRRPHGRPRAVPDGRGQSERVLRDVVVLPWNDRQAFTDLIARRGPSVAAVIMEPVLCNTSVVPPDPTFLATVRALTSESGAILVFDEVITGFRLALGGAQERLGVTPDLAVLAKAMGGGFPIAALAGRADLLDLIGAGGVVHGGTYNSGVPTVVAAVTTIDLLSRDDGAALKEIEANGERLMEGLRRSAARAELPLVVQGYGPVFNTHFSREGPATDYQSYSRSDAILQSRFVIGMLRAGVRLTRRGTWFVSRAHTPGDIDATIEIAAGVLAALNEQG